MGYKSGQGLGKHGQGRVDPVEMSKQRGRRGFGHIIKGLEPANLIWDSTAEKIVVREKVEWIREREHEPISSDEMKFWIKEGAKKLVIEDETNFCDENILQAVLNCKNVFDELDPHELRMARSRSNPFETIRNGIFLNRAAMKMANMDAICDFMFTKPKDEANKPLLTNDSLLYFADVCAGPGGFSEYVLWRRKWKAKGFGFTLKGENDFKLENFIAGPPESFQPFYGVEGQDGDGDVFNPENIVAFRDFVMRETKNQGVHFMMADGGFSVDGQENIQEILSKQLYLCQFLVALNIVRDGGNFVCKVFDLFTPFSVGLIYLMYKSFQEISIHKPNTSRPANSERYLICKWKRSDCHTIRDYMTHINNKLWAWKSNNKKDILEVVPMDVLKSDGEFFSYVYDSNNVIGENQVIGLKKIAAFCRDSNLTESRQAELKKQSLEFWEVEDTARVAPPRVSSDVLCNKILSNNGKSANMRTRALEGEMEKIEPENFLGKLTCLFEWHFAVLGSPSRTIKADNTGLTFYLSCGRQKVYALKNGRWVEDRKIELAADTLLLGEVVDELKGEHTSQFKTSTLHIVDAVRLGGVDIRNRLITERHRQCALFAEAMDKSSRNDLYRVQVKQLFDLNEGHDIIESRQRVIRTKRDGERVAFMLNNERCFLPGGIVFLKATQEPWGRTLSKRWSQKYYHAQGKDAVFDNKFEPEQTHAAFKDALSCFKDGLVWKTQLDEDRPQRGQIWAEELIEFVKKRLHHG